MKKFNHTVQQGLEAMQNLIKYENVKESKFSYADDLDEEVGYPIGTPLLYDSDGDPSSAFDIWQEREFYRDKSNEDAMIDFYLKNE